MFSKREREGVVLIDHRNSPGISEEFIRKNKIDAPAVPGGQTFESALRVCHHCQRDIILLPNRAKEANWCWSCDHDICDMCAAARAAGQQCNPFIRRMEKHFNRIAKNQVPTIIIKL